MASNLRTQDCHGWALLTVCLSAGNSAGCVRPAWRAQTTSGTRGCVSARAGARAARGPTFTTRGAGQRAGAGRSPQARHRTYSSCQRLLRSLSTFLIWFPPTEWYWRWEYGASDGSGRHGGLAGAGQLLHPRPGPLSPHKVIDGPTIFLVFKFWQ